MQIVDTVEMKQWLRQELPAVLRADPGLQQFIRDLMARDFAAKETTDERFDRIMSKLERDSEEQNRKWEEQKAEDNRKWEEQKAEDNRKWEEQNRKWDENQAELRHMREESECKWAENRVESERKWAENQAESERKSAEWREEREKDRAENQAEHEKTRAYIDKGLTRLDYKITALGARWGIYAEEAFREGLHAILDKSFGVKVVNVTEFDQEGKVFGHPDQIELDIIIHNGLLIICEIKSSVSRNDIHMFERKARFYEELHQRKAQRLIVISPMADERAMRIATKLNVEIYSHSDEVTM